MVNQKRLTYTVSAAGFPVYVDGKVHEFNVSQLTHLVELVLEYGIVVLKDQKLTRKNEIDVCKRIGRLHDFGQGALFEANDQVVDSNIVEYRTATSDIPWHYDRFNKFPRDPLHWL